MTSTFIGSALMALPANSEEIFILLLINLLTSLCRRLPKSLNIVEPPDKTMFPYSGRLVSIGQFAMTSSTTSLIDVVNSGFANSG